MQIMTSLNSGWGADVGILWAVWLRSTIWMFAFIWCAFWRWLRISFIRLFKAENHGEAVLLSLHWMRE